MRIGRAMMAETVLGGVGFGKEFSFNLCLKEPRLVADLVLIESLFQTVDQFVVAEAGADTGQRVQ